MFANEWTAELQMPDIPDDWPFDDPPNLAVITTRQVTDLRVPILFVSHDEQLGKYLRVMTRLPDQVRTFAQSEPIPIASGAPIELRVEVDFERLHFGYRVGDGPLVWLPQQFDASILSDEATEIGAPNFTGAFVGMACQDLSGAALPADFDYFDYRPRAYEAGAGRNR